MKTETFTLGPEHDANNFLEVNLHGWSPLFEKHNQPDPDGFKCHVTGNQVQVEVTLTEPETTDDGRIPYDSGLSMVLIPVGQERGYLEDYLPENNPNHDGIFATAAIIDKPVINGVEHEIIVRYEED